MEKYTKQEWLDHIEDLETGELIQEGTLFTAQRMNYIEEGIYQAGVGISHFVLVCEDRKDGDTSDSERIQRVIDESQDGDTIRFPNGNIFIDKTIILKPNRTYIGNGWGTTIKAVDNADLSEMISLPHSTNNYNTIIENIKLDGNKRNVGATRGLYIGSMVNSFIKNVYVSDCKGVGIYIDGNSEFKSNKCNIINCHSYNCNGAGLWISQYCENIHVLQGDYSLNSASGIYLEAPFSSIRDITCCNNGYNGIQIVKNSVGCQIWNSQIEGNIANGILLDASFCHISGNIIYNNAKTSSTVAGQFDGINIQSDTSNLIEGVSIMGNKIYSGLNGQTGIHRYAINIGSNHQNFSIFANDLLYQGNGTIDSSRELINGLNETDRSDYSWQIS